MKLFILALISVVAVQADRTIKQVITSRHGATLYETLLTRNANVKAAPEDEDFFNINSRKKLDLVDGDIKRNSKSSITDETMYWPGYKVPVQYAPELPLLARAGIDEARLEYEIRTCISFPDRTDEENYIYYEALSGCYSSVGMQGGPQTISIGSGCEKRATIQHEMMHALGIYHQQSRTDRDDYVRIASENIEADHLHNFNTYDYDKVDDRRVSYDYNSVMHYSDTSFSSNGGKSIITLDPAFQDVIGQRRTFSEGDAAMINRMYPCGDPIRISYSCGFETANACGYVQESKSGSTLYPMILQSTESLTSTQDKAPLTDNTHGQKGKGHYMMFDGEGVPANEITVLRSMRLKTKTDVQCLEFSYYMDLESGSKAQVMVYLAQIDTTTGDVTSSKLLTQLEGDHGEYWNLERFSFHSQNSVYKLLFEVQSGGMDDDVIALDDIQIQDKPCETSYFKVQDFSKLLESTSVGDSIYGPLLYDDEGYAFRLMFYPNGRSTPGYMSMYFSVAKGENDDSLNWPYYDRVVKMSIVDQGEEKLTSMNQFSQFITSDSFESSWQKPVSSVNSGIGYTTFMALSDITNTRNFVKNDAVIFSINIRNMQGQEGSSSRSVFVDDSSASAGQSHHQGEPEHEQQEINVNINIQANNQTNETTDDTDGMMTIGSAIGICMACTFVAMVIMLAVIMSINNTHKKSIRAMSQLVKRNNDNKPNYNNLSYEQKV